MFRTFQRNKDETSLGSPLRHLLLVCQTAEAQRTRGCSRGPLPIPGWPPTSIVINQMSKNDSAT
jgi:hypothetical protein